MKGLSYLGNKDLLDAKRYQWICRNLPKFNNADVFTDNYCTFNKISFREDHADLLIRFSPRKGRYCFCFEPDTYRGDFIAWCYQSPLVLVIHNYRELTALEILSDLYSGSEITYPLGKNFEDGLFSFYLAHGLNLGFILSRRRIYEQIQP